jgi:NitT/TauT family transport system ATP-binding protein
VAEPILRIDDVSKTFHGSGQDVRALENVSLTVADREFVALLGPSGCGKSTMLNLMAGLLTPSGGTIHINGRPVVGPPPEVGMMFQRPVLLDWRTARQNVLLPIHARDGRRVARRHGVRADELLDQVGLGGFERRYPAELSGGMQQRVAICRMLIADPEVLLLDEPFGALDELTRERMNVELAAIVSDRRKAAVLVTHNIAEAVFLADRVIVMTARPGRVAGVVDNRLERPREPGILTSAAFQALVRDVRDVLADTERSGNGD